MRKNLTKKIVENLRNSSAGKAWTTKDKPVRTVVLLGG